MTPYVRDRIQRKLDTLSDERLYQVLDYVEFLETKYAERAASTIGVFQRLAETLEDKMRVGGVAVGTITETMGMFNKAASMLNGVAQSAMSVTNDVVNAASRAVDQVGAPAGAQPTPATIQNAKPLNIAGSAPLTNSTAPQVGATTPTNPLTSKPEAAA